MKTIAKDQADHRCFGYRQYSLRAEPLGHHHDLDFYSPVRVTPLRPRRPKPPQNLYLPAPWIQSHFGSSPPETGIVAYLRRRIADLESLSPDERITPKVSSVARMIVELVATRDTVYPAVSSDGQGGINLFWVAAQREVEIEVATDRSIYVRIVNKEGTTIVNEERVARLRPQPIREMLAEMSEAIAAKTPNWRDHFVG